NGTEVSSAPAVDCGLCSLIDGFEATCLKIELVRHFGRTPLPARSRLTPGVSSGTPRLERATSDARPESIQDSVRFRAPIDRQSGNILPISPGPKTAFRSEARLKFVPFAGPCSETRSEC